MLTARPKLCGAIFIVFQILFISCEFTPHDAPETLLSPPTEAPPIQISLNNTYDTIKIDWITSFSYNITGSNQIQSVSIVFENTEICHYIDGYGQIFNFVLNPSAYPDGIYPLRIEIITSSGTGSIADKLGAEGFLYQLDWPVVIDKTPPKKLTFISIDSLSEGVKITWEKFDHPSFRFYKLIRYKESFTESVDIATIFDPDQNSFTDTSYMEGMIVNYGIELGGKSSGLNYSSTNKILYSQNPPTPKISRISDFEVELSWDPPRNIHILNYYYIFENKPTVTIFDAYRIFEPDTRTRAKPVTFGTINYFGILYVPKPSVVTFNTNTMLRGEIEFQPGEKMPEYRYAFPVRNTDFILFSNKGKIYKYGLSSGKLMDSVAFNSPFPDYFTVTSDGSIFGYSENGIFITRSSADFEILHSMSNTDFANNIELQIRLSVSDSGRLMMVLKNYSVLIFDIATGNKIAEKKFSNLNGMVGALTPDGNFVLTQEYRSNGACMEYFQITGDQLVYVDKIDFTDNLNRFPVIPNPFGPDDDIYILYKDKVEVRNIADFSLKKIIQLGGIQSIDYQNMKAVGNSIAYPWSNTGYLYDLETETVVKDLLVSEMYRTIFHNNYLIFPGGSKMFLNTNN